MNLEIVDVNEEEIFRAIDDALFFDEITKDELQPYLAIDENTTELDGFVGSAIARALNISLPDGGGWYNKSNGKDRKNK